MSMEQDGIQLLETIHPIGKVKLGIPLNKRKKIKDIIKEDTYNLKTIGGNKSNIITDYRTTWHMHDIHELFGEISDKALDVVRGFTGNDKLYAKECWGAVYEEGNGAKPHIHSVLWCWTYHVECCTKCAPLVFTERKISIKPKRDYLIFWNGICENDKYHYNKHEVPPQECEHDRVMIAGNISWC